MTRFPGLEAKILKALEDEGEVRPPVGRLGQEWFWRAASKLEAQGLCVADQAAGVVRLPAGYGSQDHLRSPSLLDLDREGDAAMADAIQGAIDSANEWAVRGGKVPALSAISDCGNRAARWEYMVDQRGATTATKIGADGVALARYEDTVPRPTEDLRSRCALLVQRWRQGGAERVRCAIDLEEVLEETKGGQSMRSRHEFRVVWKREGKARRAVRVAKLSTADRLAETQEGLEGEFAADDVHVPPLEYIRIERRPIGAWRKMK